MMGGYPRWLEYVDGKFEVKKGATKVVKNIFEMARIGMGANSIASRLNAHSIPTLTGLPTWQAGTVLYYLRNPGVAGRYVPRTKEIIDGKEVVKLSPPINNFYPRIISEKTWDLVQKEIDVRAKKSPAFWNGDRNHTKNIFGKINCCEFCGSLMARRTKNLMISPIKVTHPYLICSPRYGPSECDYGPVLYYPIHNAFLNKGAQMMDDHFEALLQKEEAEGLDLDNIERALLIPKMDNVKTLLAQTEPDRGNLKKALINLFSGVVVRIQEGKLEFIWAYGGSSELSFFKENNEYTEKLIRALEINPA